MAWFKRRQATGQKPQLILTLAMSAVAFVAGGSLATAEIEIGKAEDIKASVSTDRTPNISNNSRIFQDDRVSVNNTGLGHFRFIDGTKIVVGPGASLKLDKTIFDPAGETFSEFVLNSAAGATRFITGSSASTAFKIQTPVGVLGVRGTAFDFRHWRGRTYLMLLDGALEVCSRGNRCQSIQRKCDFVIVEADGDISPPVQPRRSLFSPRDFNRYFPFVQDQRTLNADYRLRISICRSGRMGTNDSGSDGGFGGNAGGGRGQ